jgi:hypothetical protein
VANIRRWHAYLGLFIAPSVLFFSLTGAAQLFGLHEAHGSYRPPPLVEKLSSLHKDQVFALGHHQEPTLRVPQRSVPATADPAKASVEGEERSSDSSVKALKVLFLIVAVLLVLSASLGVWIGLTQTRRPRLARLIFAAGILLPVGLMFF